MRFTNVPELNNWHEIDWQAVNADVKSLRQRIFTASRKNDRKTVKNLQKLMLRSRANWLQAIRRVTQINKGRRTPGVDREIVVDPSGRLELFRWLETITLNERQPLPTRRVEIPKGKGKKRPLGIPTVRDRVIQAIVKNALEPEWEAKFEPSSYGFRPGRSTQDAMQATWLPLSNRNNRKQWVLDADIKGAFDNISHAYLLDTIGHFPARKLIEKWLKAGVMIGLDLSPTETGTPQGGIISPLLANIALHGMEEALGIDRTKYNLRSKFRLIRYADDFVVVTESKDDAEEAKAILSQWLKVRGLVMSEEKTRIVHIDEGFDFLGFNFRRQKSAQARRGHSVYTRPSKEAIERFKTKVRQLFVRRLHSSPDQLLAELNPLIEGWGMYYRSVVSKEVFRELDHFIWYRTWRWTKRRHPNKGARWRKNRYFTRIGGWDWTFYDSDTGISIRKMSRIAIKRHVLVKGDASPDNPLQDEYWANRQKRPQTGQMVKAKLWAWQKGICPICNGWLDCDEELHVHHTMGRDVKDIRTQQLLHETCHVKVTINGTA